MHALIQFFSYWLKHSWLHLTLKQSSTKGCWSSRRRLLLSFPKPLDTPWTAGEDCAENTADGGAGGSLRIDGGAKTIVGWGVGGVSQSSAGQVVRSGAVVGDLKIHYFLCVCSSLCFPLDLQCHLFLTKKSLFNDGKKNVKRKIGWTFRGGAGSLLGTSLEVL